MAPAPEDDELLELEEDELELLELDEELLDDELLPESVLTLTAVEFALTLPAASRAETANAYDVEAASPLFENVVFGVEPASAPLR